MTEDSEVAYADICLETDEKGRTFCKKVYCVYENVNLYQGQRHTDKHTYLNTIHKADRDEGLEVVELISDIEDDDNDDDDNDDDDDYVDASGAIRKRTTSSDSEDDTHSYIDLDEEMAENDRVPPPRDKRTCSTSSCYGMGSLSVNDPYELAKPTKRVVKPPAQMTAVGMVTLLDDRIIVVTNSGEIILFDADFRFLLLREFMEKYEDVTMIDEHTVATTSGYCIRFYLVHGSNIAELGDRLINFEYSGAVTVHGIHHFHGKLAVSCNIQSVFSTEKPFIRILDLRGKHIRTIGNQNFQVPSRITCSWDGKLILVCDPDLNKVTCLTNNGTVQWERTVETKPRDIELVNDSELFVIYEESNIVVGLSAGTGKLKSKADIVTCCGLGSTPSMLTYQRQKRKLLFCLEDIIVGVPNFIFPLKVKRTQGKIKKSISFSRLHGKKLLAQMLDM